MYGYNAEQPIAIPIFTVLPCCVIIPFEIMMFLYRTAMMQCTYINSNIAKKNPAVSEAVGDKKDAIQKMPVWTKEDGMAQRIQTCYRGYR